MVPGFDEVKSNLQAFGSGFMKDMPEMIPLSGVSIGNSILTDCISFSIKVGAGPYSCSNSKRPSSEFLPGDSKMKVDFSGDACDILRSVVSIRSVSCCVRLNESYSGTSSSYSLF